MVVSLKSGIEKSGNTYMTQSTNNTDKQLVRVFKKVNQTLHDFTKIRRKAYFTIDTPRPIEAVKQSKPASVPVAVKTRTVTVQARPMEEAMKVFKKNASDNETDPENQKNRGIEHPTNDPNNPKVYYITKGKYYLMYHDEKVCAFMVSNPYWCWIVQHKQDALGNFEHCTEADLKYIVQNKLDQKELRLAYYVYRPMDWDFKTRAERDAYMELNKYVDFRTAEKV